jgi:hypothetical protein
VRQLRQKIFDIKDAINANIPVISLFPQFLKT